MGPATGRVSLLFDARPRSRFLPHHRGTEAPHPPQVGEMFGRRPVGASRDCWICRATAATRWEDAAQKIWKGGRTKRLDLHDGFPSQWAPGWFSPCHTSLLLVVFLACNRDFLCRRKAREGWRWYGVVMGIYLCFLDRDPDMEVA